MYNGNKNKGTSLLTSSRLLRRNTLWFLFVGGFVWLAYVGLGKTRSFLGEHQSNQRKKESGEFIITFVGDTLIENMAHDWEVEEWGHNHKVGDGFSRVKHLLTKSDFIVMNLEGPISDLPITADNRKRTASFSFGMDPIAAQVIKDLGVGALNMANNHGADRGNKGYQHTKMYLDQVGLPYFGTGYEPEQAAEPFFIETPTGKRVSITSFMGTPSYCCDSLPYKGRKVHTTLRPNVTHAELALNLLEMRGGADIKVAFVHWIQNYKAAVSNETRDAAAILVDAGFDVIIGSAGSHTVKEFDWVNGNPVMYDIGNFVFMKPGYWYRQDDEGRRPMTYGTVTHMIVDDDGPKYLEIHCTQNDQDKVHYKPRVCTREEADELFNNMGPYIDFTEGQTFATVDLRDQSKKSDATSGLSARYPVEQETWNKRAGTEHQVHKESYKLRLKAAKAKRKAEAALKQKRKEAQKAAQGKAPVKL